MLFNGAGSFFALDNRCTREEAPLAEGEIDDHEVICPWHGARFDVWAGAVLCQPPYEDLRCFKARVREIDVEVEI